MDMFECVSDSVFCQPVPVTMTCDEVVDCTNDRDESVGLCGCNGDTELQCNDMVCIDRMKRCDRSQDCEDGRDEKDCDLYTSPYVTHVKCDNGHCVSRIQWCDFMNNCGVSFGPAPKDISTPVIG